MVKIYKILIVFFVSHHFYSQENDGVFLFFDEIQKLNFAKSIEIANKLEDPVKTKLILLSKIIEDDRQTKLDRLDISYKFLKYNSKDNLDTYFYHIIKGFQFLNYTKNRLKSYNNFLKAYEVSLNIDSKQLSKFALQSTLIFYRKGILQGTKDYTIFLKQYKKLCTSNFDWLYYYSFKFNLLSQTITYNEKKSKNQILYNKIFEKYDSLIVNSNNLGKLKFLYFIDKGNHIIRENPKLAKQFFMKSWAYYENSKFFRFQKFYGLISLSRVTSLLNEHKKGIEYLNQAKQYISFNDSLWDKYDISAHKANHFYHLKQYDSAYYYEKDVRFLGFKINFQKENQQVSELKVELDTEKKEKENLQLKQKNLETEAESKQRRNMLIASLLFILSAGTIAILLLKNSKRKRKLAEQQKALETQKNLTLLKEQELTTINAMVDGQEKERKRIAEDLHDNLGSVLATLKLHFENLQINKEKKKINQEELFNKTESLIDEAYLKVRSIAHAKNAGVIANQGLLTAVQMMAEKISSADKINIEVIHFGLDKRLDNSLEITVFRIIQELITNIIKHAEAKNATINISLYDKNLNIIIEDNGKGFNVKKVNLKDGMGISSIKTRVEHLKGTFEIDATIGKGSSVIIDIPLE
ncbi:sensor histidine kinase [Polaribacter haliotis]|uniref:histidine kinase n=1 Tax=Polaribacter haliotis TaxID=1888915 RepID=A0A7L8AHJ1_9FLAO|nr:sensor histidine kinase [Polaribacter haliotis]QOD61485.1 sensor histidine kinase [Polaribacter haliotis]